MVNDLTSNEVECYTIGMSLLQWGKLKTDDANIQRRFISFPPIKPGEHLFKCRIIFKKYIMSAYKYNVILFMIVDFREIMYTVFNYVN